MIESLTKREFGTLLESFAVEQLKQAGCQIVDLNYSCKLGEIDIIAQERDELVFIEVRYRRNSRYGGASASVDLRKQNKIIKTANLYLQQHKKINNTACRFDVFAIEGPSNRLDFNWIKGAFSL